MEKEIVKKSFGRCEVLFYIENERDAIEEIKNILDETYSKRTKEEWDLIEKMYKE